MQDIKFIKNQEREKSDWMRHGERRERIGCDFSSFIMETMY